MSQTEATGSWLSILDWEGHPELDSSTARVDTRGSTVGAWPALKCLPLYFVHRGAVCFQYTGHSYGPQCRLRQRIFLLVRGADVVNLQEDLDKWLQQRQAGLGM